VLRDGNFWRLAALFSLLNLNHWMLISFMLPVFAAQGLGAGLAVLSTVVEGWGHIALLAGLTACAALHAQPAATAPSAAASAPAATVPAASERKVLEDDRVRRPRRDDGEERPPQRRALSGLDWRAHHG
jgi:hypothetical protein